MGRGVWVRIAHDGTGLSSRALGDESKAEGSCELTEKLAGAPWRGKYVSAFVPRRLVADQKVDDLAELFTVGKAVRGRVVRYNSLAGVVVVTTSLSRVDAPFLTAEEAVPGSIVEGLFVGARRSVGLFSIGGVFRAVCPFDHYADVALSKPAERFRDGERVLLRVWNVNKEKNTVYVSARKSVVNWRPVGGSREDVTVPYTMSMLRAGMSVVVVISSIKKAGIMGRTFGGVPIFVPSGHLGLSKEVRDSVAKIGDNLPIGSSHAACILSVEEDATSAVGSFRLRSSDEWKAFVAKKEKGVSRSGAAKAQGLEASSTLLWQTYAAEEDSVAEAVEVAARSAANADSSEEEGDDMGGLGMAVDVPACGRSPCRGWIFVRLAFGIGCVRREDCDEMVVTDGAAGAVNQPLHTALCNNLPIFKAGSNPFSAELQVTVVPLQRVKGEVGIYICTMRPSIVAASQAARAGTSSDLCVVLHTTQDKMDALQLRSGQVVSVTRDNCIPTGKGKIRSIAKFFKVHDEVVLTADADGAVQFDADKKPYIKGVWGLLADHADVDSYRCRQGRQQWGRYISDVLVTAYGLEGKKRKRSLSVLTLSGVPSWMKAGCVVQRCALQEPSPSGWTAAVGSRASKFGASGFVRQSFVPDEAEAGRSSPAAVLDINGSSLVVDLCMSSDIVSQISDIAADQCDVEPGQTVSTKVLLVRNDYCVVSYSPFSDKRHLAIGVACFPTSPSKSELFKQGRSKLVGMTLDAVVATDPSSGVVAGLCFKSHVDRVFAGVAKSGSELTSWVEDCLR